MSDSQQEPRSIWKLIAHHKKQERERAIDWQLTHGKIAVGWGGTGDLRHKRFTDALTIGATIRAFYPEAENAATGGPSLWNFAKVMRQGDLVIIGGDSGRSHVVEVTGPYVWACERDSLGDYMHQRSAIRTDHDPNDLWSLVGGRIAEGQSPYLTVVRCSVAADPADPSASVYMEGGRIHVITSRVERDPRARDACVSHYGARCFVCEMNFADRYGPEFEGVIHVHHLRPLAEAVSSHDVDPVRDLRPLCPNCHAAVHRRSPPYTPEEVREFITRQSAS